MTHKLHWIAEMDEALTLLQHSAASQVRFLKSFGVYPQVDELALMFDDAWRPLEWQLDELAEAELRPALAAVSQSLDAVQEWEADRLATSEAWSVIRSQAATALRSLHSQYGSQSAAGLEKHPQRSDGG